jgi:membrane-associated phospholipid phosphatase
MSGQSCSLWPSTSYRNVRGRGGQRACAKIWSLHPSTIDIWFAGKLASLLGRSRLLDLGIDSAIRHHVLGGYWFAAFLFVFWTQGAKPGEKQLRWRVLTTICGSLVAVALTLVAGKLVSWLPPSRNAALVNFYPPYVLQNINDNSFPSQSTALYGAVASGIFSINRILGSVLWAAVGLTVSLPHMFVGGHYLSDVLAGGIFGLLGYVAARTLLEPSLIRYLDPLFEQSTWKHVLGELIVFVLILEIAVEFQEFVWIKNSLEHVLNRLS